MDAQKTGGLIAAARREKGLTQRELAQALHVSAQAVSKWERGLNFPDLALLEPLGDLLGLTVSSCSPGRKERSRKRNCCGTPCGSSPPSWAGRSAGGGGRPWPAWGCCWRWRWEAGPGM